ncbi:MAG TPA: hypothetical protein VJS90_13915 [Pseudomonas sp.]|uniref:hypothetical protein n=1 Tax=Pseudomonas sp. TaxID=306 RepID=UPI002B4A028A|nr:hypothetical protein [Pseudomonas sp.]HKS14118.1 hypothetical protein [Pseudomonas sp.]
MDMMTARVTRFTPYMGAVLAPVLALCVWVTLNPYFLWESRRHMALAGMLAGGLAVLAFLLGDRLRRREIAGFGLICLFIIYISLLPKVDGTTTRWYFVLPTMLALAIFSDERRLKVIQYFSWIFAASLIPGIIASICAIANIPIEFQALPLLNPTMAAAGGSYLHTPGALLLSGNSLPMPWGGELYRLCAVYDEPGMVGTISAFLLAGYRFRLNRPVSAILFIGGTLSFSLAFVVMATLGFLVRLVYTRSLLNLLPLALLGLVGLTVLGVIKPYIPLREVPIISSATQQIETPTEDAPALLSSPSESAQLEAIELEQALSREREEAAAAAQAAQAALAAQAERAAMEKQHLRQVEVINNRSLPEMDQLLERYWHADTKTILFGLGADSSVVYGGVSQVVTRLFTDFGLIGAVLFAGGMLCLIFAITTNSQSPVWALLFFTLFALSIYQRPIVWMPYAFTLFICCSTLAGYREPRSASRSNLS